MYNTRKTVLACRIGIVLLMLQVVIPMSAQYITSTEGMVQDMSSTSSYLGRECPDNVTDTACYTVSRTSSDWTPIRNGYLITEVLAERPQGIGFGRRPQGIASHLSGAAEAPGSRMQAGMLGDLTSRRSLSLTPTAMSRAAMAAEPEDLSSPETLHRGGPRRVSPDGGLGEPGPLPVGDIPWGLVVLIMSFELGIRNWRRRLRNAN